MSGADCLFCRIASGLVTADVVESGDDVVVIRDIRPQAPTHVLAIPRRHVRSAHELRAADAPLLAAVFAALQRVAERERLAGGYRIVTNVGPDAGQSEDHLHFHLLGGRELGPSSGLYDSWEDVASGLTPADLPADLLLLRNPTGPSARAAPPASRCSGAPAER